jgi:hypothetical protein
MKLIRHSHSARKCPWLKNTKTRLRREQNQDAVLAGAHPAAHRHVHRAHRQRQPSDDGCYILLKEVVDNAIDEYIMGHGKEVQITIAGNRVSVRDFGRGIPLGKVVDCVSKINTGAKYNDDVFQFSVGLNGVGTKAVNALVQNFFCPQPSRRRICRGQPSKSANSKRKIPAKRKSRTARSSSSSRTRTFSRTANSAGTHRTPVAALQLSEHRAEADFENAGLPEPNVFQSRHGSDGFGDGRSGKRRQRTDLSAAALRGQDAGVLFHAQQFSATARRFIPSSTASTPATAAHI